MKYAGLTDDPKTRKRADGYPQDWHQLEFANEKEARVWEKTMLAVGYEAGPGEKGWRYGYTYTITNAIKE